MVGIVIVSHSKALARAIVELAQQMVKVPVPIAIAAGINDPQHPFGTDPIQIQKAIRSVYSDEGVIVLMDLGSALLSAEMAVEFLNEKQQPKVKLCAAPLVEGAITAIVQASCGATLEQIITEANNALSGKLAQLSPQEADQPTVSFLTQKSQSHLLSRDLIVKNPLGIHARPAAQFVSIAAQFEAEIGLENRSTNSQSINGKSINQVITLGVRQGHQIRITAGGEDAALALNALREVVENNFGETAMPLPVDLRQCENRGVNTTLRGIPASVGVAMGPVIIYRPSLPQVDEQTCKNPQSEWQQLQAAIQTAQQQIHQIIQSTDHCDIFQAHLLYLQDPTILHQVHHNIFTLGQTVAWAWKTVIEETMTTYQNLDDPYLQARAMDVLDVGGRVLRLLTGRPSPSPNLTQPGILIAQDLTPSEVTHFKTEQVLGICTVTGSPTAHSALIANMLGIPMIVNVGAQLLELAPETVIAMDGKSGEIWMNPDPEQISIFPEKTPITPEQKAITQDGHYISVVANIIGVADAQLARNLGAEGVGILRTELLYMERLTAPTEEEQLQTYREIASILNPYPLTIRTLDIGGDKPVPYLSLDREANPFLGWRGIRQSLDNLEMFKTQLRAILRASQDNNIRLMFPMVSSVAEVRAAKAILLEVKQELQTQGIEFNEKMPVGIMIEVPAAVTMVDKLAPEVDFLSVGTNDLSQYIMAADRTNAKVAKLADAFEPAVLRMVEHSIKIGHEQGIKVSVCGQIASARQAVPILIGLGADELSVNPPCIGEVKAVISGLKMQEVKRLAYEVLELDSAQEVRDYVNNIF
ncbi:phosphoenolpyruvate--protein phosphotransferase [Gloeothece verrucosa]|uniref:Phosphocarrier protein HPr n=1 Tax=Gloeothece verrucosa (strain PCC 7822) TaxID=497965 RepID=E0UJ41_GLOV7|nr:phosphoenolpyruvate--protein phosphotransferase [Gloeothece verrucosa]ADN15744.1 phosphoenolpyruvate-protein phosphotransferase [Gloeothece verrucosa PCC 7822]